MTLEQDKANERLNSPTNLANRFRRDTPVAAIIPESVPEPPAAAPQTEIEIKAEPDITDDVNLAAMENEAAILAASDSDIAAAIQKVSKKGRGVGRKPGVPNFPESLRTTAAILSHVDSQSSVGKELGMSQMEVSFAKRGKVPTNKHEINRQLGVVRDVAMDRLMASLNLMTDDKLDACKAPELAAVADKMGKIIANTMEKDAATVPVTLLVYAPEMRTEKQYNVVEVSSL